MCSRIGGQAASVPEDKSRKLLPGHIRTTQPHRGRSLRDLKVVGRREHGNVICNWGSRFMGGDQRWEVVPVLLMAVFK